MMNLMYYIVFVAAQSIVFSLAVKGKFRRLDDLTRFFLFMLHSMLIVGIALGARHM